MTDFSQVWKRINHGKSRAKNFQQVLDRFKSNGRNVGTDKQVKSLAIEANQHKIRDTNKQDKKGRWHNIITGQIVKNEHSVSKIPIWRENEVRKERGSVVNINTGERYKIRYASGKHKGQLMIKEKWTYTNRKGNTRLIYPKQKKKRGR
jgi:hypothetical protein